MEKIMQKPESKDYPASYEGYINNVADEDPIRMLEEQFIELRNILSPLDDSQAAHAYAEGKWSIKELIGHLIDTERVMSYRALAIARGEKQHLPGFDEKDYAKESNINSRNLSRILNEYHNVRKATLSLFKSFDENILSKRGVANNSEITVNAIVYMVAGHEKHHIKILKERYL
jgi:hypothetical protein